MYSEDGMYHIYAFIFRNEFHELVNPLGKNVFSTVKQFDWLLYLQGSANGGWWGYTGPEGVGGAPSQIPCGKAWEPKLTRPDRKKNI